MHCRAADTNSLCSAAAKTSTEQRSSENKVVAAFTLCCSNIKGISGLHSSSAAVTIQDHMRTKCTPTVSMQKAISPRYQSTPPSPYDSYASKHISIDEPKTAVSNVVEIQTLDKI